MNAIMGLIGVLTQLLIFAAIGLAVLLFFIYNNTQKKGHAIREAHSNIMISMKKRVDLANKLIDIATGYGDHEKLTHITVSHSVGNPAVITDSLRQSNAAINHVMALARGFPELRASETYKQLMTQLEAIETDLQRKREAYNSVVKNYNMHISQLPTVLFASVLGFKQASYFDVEDSDALGNLKDFHTDDGTMLKATMAAIGTKIVDASKSLGGGVTKVGTIAYEKLHGKTQNASSDQQVSDNKDIAIHKPSFCSNCGFKVAAASKFCIECGSQLS